MITFSKLIETIRNMNNPNHRAKLTQALEDKDNETALSLILNKTFGDKLYRAGFYVMHGGKSLLDTGWGGVTSPLAQAAEDGNMDVLEALLKSGAKVDSKDYSDWTPLHSALRYGQAAAAIALINAGADVNARFRNINGGTGDRSPYFPLHVALTPNRMVPSLPVIRALVERGAELNVGEGYNNILSVAVNRVPDDNPEVIEYLLRQGANPNAVGMARLKYNHVSGSPLYFALAEGKTQIAIILLRHRADIYLQKARDFVFGGGFNRIHNYRYVLSPEMIHTAIQLCRANDINVPEEPVRQIQDPQPMLNAYVDAGKNKKNEINTHAASIHKTVSESAARLQKSSKISIFNRVNLQIINDLLKVEKNLVAVQNLIIHACKDLKTKPSTATISASVIGLMQKISQSTFVDDGLDHGSKIKLSELLSLILEAIIKLPSENSKRDALLKLCEHMYFAQVEEICESGIFNTLIYSQQSILSEVQILIQTKTDATDSWSNKLKDFAKMIYSSKPTLDTPENLEAVVKKHATEQECARIMREIFSEYYLTFNLKSPQEAASLSVENLDKLCMDFTGSKPKDIFDSLDYSRLHKDLSNGTIKNRLAIQ